MNPYRLYFGLIEVFFIFYKHSRLVEKKICEMTVGAPSGAMHSRLKAAPTGNLCF
jgi:hypothetical protein